MTTMHTRSRLPRQEFLNTGADVHQMEAAHAASEIDDEPDPPRPPLKRGDRWALLALAVALLLIFGSAAGSIFWR